MDRTVTRWLADHHNSAFDIAAAIFGWLGSPGLVVTTAITLAVLWHQRQRRALSYTMALAVTSWMTSNVLKILVPRERPINTGQIFPFERSFPSGHVLIGLALFVWILYLAWPHLSPLRRACWSAVKAAVLVAIGWSRLYDGSHWLSDVLGGYLLGTAVVLWIIRRFSTGTAPEDS